VRIPYTVMAFGSAINPAQIAVKSPYCRLSAKTPKITLAGIIYELDLKQKNYAGWHSFFELFVCDLCDRFSDCPIWGLDMEQCS
jgi:hypothetical protein